MAEKADESDKENYKIEGGEEIMKKYVMVIDEGTTGTRALIYDRIYTVYTCGRPGGA